MEGCRYCLHVGLPLQHHALDTAALMCRSYLQPWPGQGRNKHLDATSNAITVP